MDKKNVFIVGALPMANEDVKKALHIAFGEINFHAMSTLSDERSEADLVIASFATAKEIENARTAKHLQFFPALVGIGNGELQYGEVCDDSHVAPENLARICQVAVRMQGLREENLRLKGDLLTVARRFTHDLRSPIACIQTNADILKELGLTALDEQMLNESTDLIIHSAEEATALADRLSQILKATADPIKLENVDCGSTFQDALQHLELGTASISTPDAWPRVVGVAPWLTNIWTNLVGNALRHGGPKIEIRAEHDAARQCIQFSVTDNGSGVPERQLSFLFKPFDQLHTVRGGGLGLSIVHRLVTLMGGSCAYRPVPEGGACFSFRLTKAD